MTPQPSPIPVEWTSTVQSLRLLVLEDGDVGYLLATLAPHADERAERLRARLQELLP